MFNTIGVIGLGVMGSNLAINMASKVKKAAVYNYTRGLTDQLVKKTRINNSIRTTKLKVLFSPYAIESVTRSLVPFLDSGEIIMDSGNSHYEDTGRRYDELKSKGINYLGIGISGGEIGALTGPSIVPGGDKEVYEKYHLCSQK
jgi:6-phosphogluconate dehydrogenase